MSPSPIDAAIGVIGSNPDDYKIEPTKHASETEATTPALAALLRTKNVSVLAEEHEHKDKEAGARQSEFKQTATRANLGGFPDGLFRRPDAGGEAFGVADAGIAGTRRRLSVRSARRGIGRAWRHVAVARQGGAPVPGLDDRPRGGGETAPGVI